MSRTIAPVATPEALKQKRAQGRSARVAPVAAKVTLVHPSRYIKGLSLGQGFTFAVAPVVCEAAHPAAWLVLEGFDLAVIGLYDFQLDRKKVWIAEATAKRLSDEDWRNLLDIIRAGAEGHVVPLRPTTRLRELGFYPALLEVKSVALAVSQRWLQAITLIDGASDLIESILSVATLSVWEGAPDVDLSFEELIATKNSGRLAAWLEVARTAVAESREVLAGFLNGLDETYRAPRAQPPIQTGPSDLALYGYSVMPGIASVVGQTYWKLADQKLNDLIP